MRIAILIPCFNEETTIGRVVRDFSAVRPDAGIYVYDNNSTDRTAEIAAGEGAIVRRETLQGKGHVVCRMFADVDADVYVLVDGDDTYDAASAPRMIERLLSGQFDLVNGTRMAADRSAYRAGHQFGNRMLTWLAAQCFGNRCSDMLSGYRVFSRRYVKSFPLQAGGFEIEAALTIHALDLRMPIAEIETPYKARPDGSASKLNTIRDGTRILWAIFRLVEEERPLQLFGFVSLLFAAASITLAFPVISTYLRTGLVPRLPTAVLSASLMGLAFLSAAAGLIIDMITLGRREAKRLAYLTLPAPGVAEWPAPANAHIAAGFSGSPAESIER